VKEYIKWELYSDEPLDPADPLGIIIVIGDREAFKIQNIFLDSFFETFIKGLNLIKSQNTCSVEIIDESYELILTKRKVELQIQFKEQSMFVADIKTFFYSTCQCYFNFFAPA